MKKYLLLLLLGVSFTSFSQFVSLDINGNFQVNGTSSVWWSYRYRPVGTSTYTTSATIYSSSTLVKLNPFITYEFSSNFYSFSGQPGSWGSDFIVNDAYGNLLPKNVGYTYDFNTEDLLEGWRGYRLQYTTSNNYSNVQEIDNSIFNSTGESLFMGWRSSNGVMLVSPKISDLGTDKKFSFYIHSYQGNYKLEIGTISDPYDTSTFHPLKIESLVGIGDFYKVEIFMNNYNSNDQYIAIKSNGNIGDVYLDDFAYEQSVNCFDTTNLTVANVNQESALVSFDADSNQTTWELYKKDLTHNITETIIINQNPYLLENLTGETTYEIKIRANCDVGLYSNWTSLTSFTTPCENISSGYSTSFLESSYLDPCWTKNVVYSSIYQAPVTGNTSIVPRTGSRYIQMSNSSTSTSQQSLLVTPYINDLDNNKRVKFYLVSKGGSDYNTNPLVVGSMSDPNDATTFVPISTISPFEMNEIKGFQVNDYWKEHIVYLDNYDNNLNHNYIALKQGNISSTFHIDDFTYEDTPSCKEPVNLFHDKITQNTAIIKWDAYDNSYNEWEIQYGLTGFSLGTGTTVTSTTNPLTLTNLLQDAFYDFYVRSKCGNQYSNWSDRGAFKTKCEGVTAGYTDGFEVGLFDDYTCWTRLTAKIRQNYYSANSQLGHSTLKKHTGVKSIMLYNNYSSNPLNVISKKILVTPKLIDLNNEKTISFWGYLSSTGVSGIEIGTLSDPDDYLTFTPYTVLTNLTQDQWVKHSVDLSDYYGTDKYIGIRLVNTTNSNDVFYIDDFEYLQSDCTRPSGLTAFQLNSDSVELNWNTNTLNSINCEIEYGEIGFTPGTGTFLNTATIPTIVTGLNSNTNYQFRVRNNCSSSTVNWSNFYDFKVSCVVNSPFSENFDSYTSDTNVFNIPDICWTTNENGNGGIYAHVFGDFINNYTSAINSLRLYTASTSESAYLISPFISDFDNNKKLKFWVLGQDYNTIDFVSIGTIKNPLDLSTYEEYERINLDNLSLNGKEVYVDFENYTGENKMFAIKIPHPNQSNISKYISIDDVNLDNKNGCKDPVNIQFSEISNNSTKIAWDDTFGDNVEIEYGLQGFIQGNGIILNSNSNQIAVSNLQAATQYDFYFKRVCQSVESVVIGPKKVDTTCEIEPLPWSENFNNLAQYGANILPDCFKYQLGSFNLKNASQIIYSNSFYDNDHLLNGYDDNTYIHFSNNFSTEILSPMFNLIAGTTYKFSLQARKAYEYSPMGIYLSVGRGQERYYMESNLQTVGYLTEYNYSELEYYFTPLETGNYSYLINPRYEGSVNVITDNFKLDEGYENIIATNNEVFDFQNGYNNKLINESTQTSFVTIQSEVNNVSNKVLRMTGANNSSNWKTNQTDAWVNNQNHITKVNFKIDATAMTSLFLKFNLKQTFKDEVNNSKFRVVINGNIIGGETLANTNNSDLFAVHQYDLASFLGGDIKISLQHLGKNSTGLGDNAYLDNIELTSLLSNNGFEQNKLVVYPNPIKNILHIENNQSISKVEIFNTSGQKLLDSNYENNNLDIDFSSYTSGVYFMRITSENSTKMLKVIKE